ncbi:hypothetical protein GCM10023088_67230 [Actinomadura verrucosospora]
MRDSGPGVHRRALTFSSKSLAEADPRHPQSVAGRMGVEVLVSTVRTAQGGGAALIASVSSARNSVPCGPDT